MKENEKEVIQKQIDENKCSCECTIEDCEIAEDDITDILKFMHKPNNQDIRIVDVLIKYASSLGNDSSSIYVGDIPGWMILNAISKFDDNIDYNTVIAICDTTLFNSGKTGYIFTNEKLYSREIAGKTKSFYYKDVKRINIIKHLNSDNYNDIEFVLKDNSTVLITESHINKTPLKNCINEIIALY